VPLGPLRPLRCHLQTSGTLLRAGLRRETALLQEMRQGRFADCSALMLMSFQDSMNRTEGSPPERKRLRPSPNGGEHPLPPGPPQQPQQQQPLPMAPMAPFNHQGLTGAQNMQMRMGNPPMGFNPGVHMTMNQGMPQMGPGAGSPGMMVNPPPTMAGAQNAANITPQVSSILLTCQTFSLIGHLFPQRCRLTGRPCTIYTRTISPPEH
jgi:hypothetical protein